MSTETFADTSDDLDLFSATFFGQKDTTAPANVEDNDPGDSDAPLNDDTQTGNPVHDEVNEEDFVPEPEVKPKKTRFQERIDEVVGQRETEKRRADELQAKLDALTKQAETPKPTQAVVEDEPDPYSLNEDGTEKYPLGEFDPQYIRDLTRFSNEQWHAKNEARKAEELANAEVAKAQTELKNEWNNKLETVQERYPDFREKGQNLIDTFSGISQAYGEYLSTTIMSMEYGPDVLYYLSNHPEEAHAIVNSGATKATIALGRLEARFSDFNEEKNKPRPKVSQAPTPPPSNKGSAVSRPEIEDDTDDLDAFSKKFFKRR